MASIWVDQGSTRTLLANFFNDNKNDISVFGNTVNQTFEAFVFASVVNWYIENGWSIEFKHPDPTSNLVKLKFNTRGQPDKYTYVVCTKQNQTIQVRHCLRVATKHHASDFVYPANVVLDVAVIFDADLSQHKTDHHVDNSQLITFGEAKHMSAFAELVANFIGLVHEIRPEHIDTIRPYIELQGVREHPAPFLYVSGNLNPTAQGIAESIRRRGYDIDVFDYQTGIYFGVKLPFMFAPKSPSIAQASNT